jgi:hypothetical protein
MDSFADRIQNKLSGLLYAAADYDHFGIEKIY